MEKNSHFGEGIDVFPSEQNNIFWELNVLSSLMTVIKIYISQTWFQLHLFSS